MTQVDNAPMKALLVSCLSLCVSVLCSKPVSAQTNDVWSGGIGSWTDASMWSTGVPTASSNVIIGAGPHADEGPVVGSGTNADANTASIASNATLVVETSGGTAPATLTIHGTSIVNSGIVAVASNGNGSPPPAATLAITAGQNVSLSGRGTLFLEFGLVSGGAGSILTNVDNLITNDGQSCCGLGNNSPLILINQKNGVIRVPSINASGGITNQGLIVGGLFAENTAVSNTGTILSTAVDSSSGGVQIAGTITNSGNLSVNKNDVFQISGTLTNFSGTTLRGGSYAIKQFGILLFPGANIVTDAAHISLYGGAQIRDQFGNNGLRNLAAIAPGSSLGLLGGGLATPGNLINAGDLTIASANGDIGNLQVNGTFTQTQGTTVVTALMTATSGVTVSHGILEGSGTISSPVVSSGMVITGNNASKPGKLSISAYTQKATGTLEIPIRGLTADTQYGQLAVANGASLNGTLAIKLLSGFVPPIGSTFTILTSSALSGHFASVTGTTINSSEHFAVAYGATSVTLTVESGS